MKTVLTIAGSDPSGGAGIQADLKTIAAHRLYGMSVITALTAQNTLGVSAVFDVPRDFFKAQLSAVLCDIPPDGTKIGMMPNAAIVDETARLLREYGTKNIVTDPVMLSSSGRRLMEEDAAERMKREIFPISAVVTPNIPEAEVLWGEKISGEQDMRSAAQALSRKYGTAVLVKGGHAAGNAIDILCWNGELCRWEAPRLRNLNTHGTGCTLSSAIACGLVSGLCIPDSVAAAKHYLTEAIRRGLNLGHGVGPLDHTPL